VREDDRILVSYPKSGNTWLRFLVGSLLSPTGEVTFLDLPRLVPDIYETPERRLARMPGPRTLKSHEYFDPRYPRVLFLVRDPRDVVVSYYHYLVKQRKLEETGVDAEFVGRCLTGRLDTFGSWADNVGSWLGARRRSEGFLLVRYEDLLADTAVELGRIAAFLCIPAPKERLDAAVAAGRVDRMRSLEREQTSRIASLRDSREDRSFVRLGRSGGYRDELPEEEERRILRAWGPLMEELGYPGADGAR
jgi:hypothetical protein